MYCKMRAGDVVHITGISSCKILDPLYALVIEDIEQSGGKDARLIIVTGGYNASGWCRPGHRFHLPERTSSAGSEWRVLKPKDVPNEVCVEIAKRALVSRA